MSSDPTNQPAPFAFAGFRRPSYTQVPDELFDELLPQLSGPELKVLLYIIRRTFGFKRERDAISLSQMLHGIRVRDGRVLDRGVGLSKPTLLSALRGLSAKRVIRTERRRSAERGDEPTIYGLWMAGESEAVDRGDQAAMLGGERRAIPLVKGFDQGEGKDDGHPLVKELPPQETGERQTDFDLSKDGIEGRAEARPEGDRARAAEPLADSLARWRQRLARPPARSAGRLAGDGRRSAQRPPFPLAGGLDAADRARPMPRAETYAVLEAYMADFAREFGDRAPLRSSTTRLANLAGRSGLGLDAFVAQLFAARSLVRERTGSGARPVRNRVGYWFATLEDLLGLRAPVAGPPGTPGEAASSGPAARSAEDAPARR